MKIEALESAFQRIREESEIAPAVINHFIRNLYNQSQKNWIIHPIEFASQTGITLPDCIEILLRASRLKVFNLQFLYFCPNCKFILKKYSYLQELEETRALCGNCSKKSIIEIDQNLAVQFEVNRDLIREEELTEESYSNRYFLSAGSHESSQHQFLLKDMIREHFKLETNSSHRIRMQPKSSRSYQIIAPAVNSSVFIRFNENIHQPFQDHKITIKLTRNGFSPAELSLPLGPFIFKIENHSGHSRDLALMRPNWDQFEQQDSGKVQTYPAHALFHHSLFLSQFSLRNFPPIKARHLPALSCELDDVESLYLQLPDIEAHELLQRVEELFIEAITRAGGTLVESREGKLFSVFYNSEMAVLASLDILTRARLLKENLRKQNLEVNFRQALHCDESLLSSSFQGAFYSGKVCLTLNQMLEVCRPMDILISEAVFEKGDLSTSIQNYRIQKFVEQITLPKLNISMKTWRLCYA